MTRLLGIFVLLLTLAGASFGYGSHAAPKSIVGTWTGKISVTLSAAAKAKLTPAQITEQMNKLKTISLKLTIVKGGTYTITVSAAPQTDTGTWKQSGSTITLTNTPKNGAKPQSQTATLSANGKTMTLKLPQNPMGSGVITFTR